MHHVFLNLFVAVLGLLQAVTFDPGMPGLPAAQGSPTTNYLVTGAHRPGKAALEAPAFRLDGSPQNGETKVRKQACLPFNGEACEAPVVFRWGWQSETAVITCVSRERTLLFPFHTYF